MRVNAALCFPACRCLKDTAGDRFLLKKWELLEVIKRRLKPCSTIFLSCETNVIRLTPYHSNLAFRIFVTSEKQDFAKFLAKYQISRCLFSEKFCSVILFWLMKIRNAGLPMVRSQTDEIYFANYGNGGTRFGHLFITSSYSQFFNEINLDSSSCISFKFLQF